MVQDIMALYIQYALRLEANHMLQDLKMGQSGSGRLTMPSITI